MASHTHKGTCQVCGAVQAVNNKNGLLAKHGYTTRWGFFSGTCSGSDNLPFEKSHDMVTWSINWANGKIAKANAEAADLRAQTGVEGFWNHFEKATWQNRRSYHVECPAVYFVAADGKAGCTYQFADKELPGLCRERSIRGTPEQNAAESRERVANDKDRRAAELAEYVAHQAKRIEDWVKKNLIPVAKSA